MTLQGTFQPGSRLGPPAPVGPPNPGTAPVIDVMGGELRVGAIVTVSNSQGRPCFVQVRAPTTDDFEQPWVDLDLDQPVPTFTLGYQHMGHSIRVVAKGVDANRRPTGADVYSNELGPVLHSSEPTGTTVSNSTEFGAALTAGAEVIILAAGSEWTTDFLAGRNFSNRTITTPQSNPAVVRDTYLRPGTIINVVFEGIIFRHSAAWAEANRNGILQTGTSSRQITFRSCKQIGDDVLAATYQAVPPTRAESPYVGGGMRFLAYGFELFRSRDITLEGHFTRNTFRGFTLPSKTTIRHLRIHGWYFDCAQINGSQSLDTDELDIRDYYNSNCYGIYNEMNATAPHCDHLQGAANPAILRGKVDRMVNCIGDTRAYAFGGTITNVIYGDQRWRNFRFRDCVWTGNGPISGYNSGSDNAYYRLTKSLVGGTGGNVMRFGGGSIPGQFWYGEARVDRSISREPITRVAFDDNGYYVQKRSQVPTSGTLPTINDLLVGPINQVPKSLSDLGLIMAPQLATDDGALLPSGHMRPFVEMPEPPTMVVAPTVGGFTATLGEVAGAEDYELRYRPSGDNSLAWTRIVESDVAFAVTASAGSYDVQCFTTTSAGHSGWSAPQTVVVS